MYRPQNLTQNLRWNLTQKIRLRMRAFGLIEAMSAIAVAGIAFTAAIGLYVSAMRQAALQKHEFIALSIAQQKMEMLASVPLNSPLLSNSSGGDVHDASPESGVDGPDTDSQQVNGIGEPDPDGPYRVYWKIENTSGSIRSVVVYTRYPSPADSVNNYVSLETMR